jgi:hypothetical protein
MSKAVRYSNIVKIVNEDAAPQLVLLSNPVKGNIVFKYQSPVSGPVTAVLVDMNGREVGKKIIPVQKGISTVQMSTDGSCPAGMYVLRVIATNNSCTQKVQLVK